jgi:hypothetical protein
MVLDCFDDRGNAQFGERISHFILGVIHPVKQVRVAAAVAASKTRHPGRNKKICKTAFAIPFCRSTKKIPKLEMWIKEKVIDVPAGNAVPMQVQAIMPSHPGESARSACGADISIPSGGQFYSSKRPDR